MTDAALEPALIASLVLSRGRKAARSVLEQWQLGAAPPILEAERSGAEAIARQCRRHDQALVDLHHPDFPHLLRQIPDPPLVLFVRGDIQRLQMPAVALVGARRCTRLGREMAAYLAHGIATAGWLVISGLARGIDSAAHAAAADLGRTAAVLGNGLARPYPAANRSLAEKIVAGGGVLLSEHPPHTPPRPYYFPERNRLISGLSRAVVVVEAGDRSGSLITARLALEQGRDVMAVPGPVSSPVSRGCHQLIRDGAALVESTRDLFEALGLEYVADGSSGCDGRDGNVSAFDSLDPELSAVLGALDQSMTTLDELVLSTGEPAPRVISRLAKLELLGFVRQVPGGYIRRPPAS